MCCASLLETVTEKSATPVLLAHTPRRRTRRRIMKYICLRYLEPGKFEGMTEDERNATFDECFEHNDHLRANGHLVAEVPLQPPETALTLFPWPTESVEFLKLLRQKPFHHRCSILLLPIHRIVHAPHIVGGDAAAQPIQGHCNFRMPLERLTPHNRHSVIRWKIMPVVFEDHQIKCCDQPVSVRAGHDIHLI